MKLLKHQQDFKTTFLDSKAPFTLKCIPLFFFFTFTFDVISETNQNYIFFTVLLVTGIGLRILLCAVIFKGKWVRWVQLIHILFQI